MRRLGRGGSPSPSPTPPPPPSPNCKVEAGVKEINSALCSAMFGLVLSDQAYREFQARQVGQDKVNSPTSVSLFLLVLSFETQNHSCRHLTATVAKPGKQCLDSICILFGRDPPLHSVILGGWAWTRIIWGRWPIQKPEKEQNFKYQKSFTFLVWRILVRTQYHLCGGDTPLNLFAQSSF